MTLGLFHARAGRIRGMEDEGKERSWSVPTIIALALIFVAVLYVLSTGPALWLENHGYLAVGVMGTVYFPITLACESSETIDSALVWYWRFWT